MKAVPLHSLARILTVAEEPHEDGGAPVPLHSSARILTVVLLMISWLVATNHCALGLMKPTVQAEHSLCHGGKPAPGKGAPAGGTRECCKSIHGMPAPDKVEAKFDATQFHISPVAFLEVLSRRSAERAMASFVFDHGPPRSISFAESVLQRSLLSHAPPFAV